MLATASQAASPAVGLRWDAADGRDRRDHQEADEHDPGEHRRRADHARRPRREERRGAPAERRANTPEDSRHARILAGGAYSRLTGCSHKPHSVLVSRSHRAVTVHGDTHHKGGRNGWKSPRKGASLAPGDRRDRGRAGARGYRTDDGGYERCGPGPGEHRRPLGDWRGAARADADVRRTAPGRTPTSTRSSTRTTGSAAIPTSPAVPTSAARPRPPTRSARPTSVV